MSAETPTTSDEPSLPFDEAVAERIKAAFRDIFLHHPEVKCLSAIIGWNGDLNDADICHAVWMDPNGAVQTPDGIITSLYQTLRLFDQQAGRAMKLVERLRAQIVDLSRKVVDGHVET